MFRKPFQARALCVSGVLAIVAAAVPAGAQPIVPVSQDRRVDASAVTGLCGGQGVTNSILAPGLGVFDETVEATHLCSRAEAHASAGQISFVDSALIFITLDSDARGGAAEPSTIIAIGSSSFDVTFELTEASDFALNGLMTGSATGGPANFGQVEIRLTRVGGATVFRIRETTDQQNPLSIAIAERGALSPGAYRLEASAGSIVDAPAEPTGSVETAMKVNFSVTGRCPGDLNGDGMVDLVDLGILLADFGCSGGNCVGDIDGDGDTDLADLGILLSNFGQACP